MKKIRLFNEYSAFTQDANNLSIKLANVIEPILKEASNQYPLRDIEVVAVSTMGQVTSELIVRAAIDKLSEDEDKDEDGYETLIISVIPEWEHLVKNLLSPLDWKKFKNELINSHEERLIEQLSYLNLDIRKTDNDKFLVKGVSSEISAVPAYINISEFKIMNMNNAL